ncbi:probable G-protein coupled receptor 141 [Ambystoma mexicanum]|uniref:probable G-protein coupled receptor 141 n=1 Tax=Ambystoma mexicanum TaxID=8296 RepID=UPI0037E774A7
MDEAVPKLPFLSNLTSGLSHQSSGQHHLYQNQNSIYSIAGGTASTMSNATRCIMPEAERKAMTIVLITVYSLVLVGGVCGAIVTSFFLCTKATRSVNFTLAINLLVVHAIFLLTVPFRITYYIKGEWMFGFIFCKMVSAMIHVHMYVSLIFYVTIIVSRCLTFFKKKDMEFYRKVHAVAASLAVWALVIFILVPLLVSLYGKSSTDQSNVCFHFQAAFSKTSVRSVNYIIIAVVLAVLGVLLCVQIFIVVKVVGTLKRQTFGHQEFWAELKSLMSVVCMVICFFPTHLYKLYYLTHSGDCRAFFYNELCLSMTAWSCHDMIALAVLNHCCKHRITRAIVINKRVCC